MNNETSDTHYKWIPEVGGFRVNETPTHYIDVVLKLFSWRICRTPKASPLTYDRGYCYNGNDGKTLIATVLAALAWDGADDTDPPGWNKNLQTGELREPDAAATD